MENKGLGQGIKRHKACDRPDRQRLLGSVDGYLANGKDAVIESVQIAIGLEGGRTASITS